MQREAVVRVAVFVTVLGALALAEAVRPRRARGLLRRQRWPHNLGLVAAGSVAMRVVAPAGAASIAVLAESRGWGVLRALDAPIPVAWVASIAALDVVDAFIDLWERDRAVLRVIDLVTDEGDQRFREVRRRLLSAPTEAFVAVLRTLSARATADPLADAGVLVSMLAHVAAHLDGLRSWGADGDELRRSMARVVATTLSGQWPSSS